VSGFKFSEIKINEIARITGTSTPLISRNLKQKEENRVTRINNRIIGVSPEAAQDYFTQAGLGYLYMPSVTLFANLCGGVGKTSGIINLSSSIRRITDRNTAIVLIDGDSQASLTGTIFGDAASDDSLLLVDYLEERATLDDIITELEDNVWIIKSNLNQAWIEKVLSKPRIVKEGMLRLYNQIFQKLGKSAKIFQDHSPQLSSLFVSSVCALYQLKLNVKRSVLIPMRSDSVAITGAGYILKEIDDVIATFSFNYDYIDIHAYFSNVDRRYSTTSEALELVKNKPNVMKHLSSPIIRTCTDITKATMNGQNVFSTGKSSNSIEDFQDLMQFMYQFGIEQEG